MNTLQSLEQLKSHNHLNRCTYDITKNHYQHQYYRRCLDCFHGEGEGACLNCISVCHSGHRVENFVRLGRFYCDCGAETSTKTRCKLINFTNHPIPKYGDFPAPPSHVPDEQFPITAYTTRDVPARPAVRYDTPIGASIGGCLESTTRPYDTSGLYEDDNTPIGTRTMRSLGLFGDVKNQEARPSRSLSLFGDATIELAYKLHMYARMDKDGQQLYSPASIASAMLIAHLGTINGSVVDNEFKRMFGINSKISSEDVTKIRMALDCGVVKSSNHVLLNNTRRVGEEWIKDVNNLEICNVSKEDFKNTKTISQKINTLISQETFGKIKDIVNPDMFKDPRILLVIINTIYFKAKWKHEFEKSLTRLNAPFTSFSGLIKNVEMMKHSKSISIPYYEDSKLQLIELPYRNSEKDWRSDFVMGIMLPKQDGTNRSSDTSSNLDDINFTIDGDFDRQYIQNLNHNSVYVSIPKFKFRKRLELTDAFKQLGMVKAFEKTADGFPFISLDCFISKILHEAYIEVDEVGTEAAAATIVTCFENCMVTNYKTFTADHTFTYYIRHRPTNTILFWGTFDGDSNQ